MHRAGPKSSRKGNKVHCEFCDAVAVFQRSMKRKRIGLCFECWQMIATGGAIQHKPVEKRKKVRVFLMDTGPAPKKAAAR